MNELSWLVKWYISKCNGEWEDYYGIKIVTLDNPGWLVEIDILETDLENIEFVSISVENTEEDWMNCRVENGKYIGVGDKSKLSDIIRIFKEWNDKIISV